MIELTMYKCEKCGKLYEKSAEAAACERSELKIVAIKKAHYDSGLTPYPKHTNVPIAIEVEMEDKSILRYTLLRR